MLFCSLLTKLLDPVLSLQMTNIQPLAMTAAVLTLISVFMNLTFLDKLDTFVNVQVT